MLVLCHDRGSDRSLWSAIHDFISSTVTGIRVTRSREAASLVVVQQRAEIFEH